MLFGDLLDNWSDTRARLGWARFAAYLGVATALVLTAPFGTVGEPWLWRLAYWLLLIAFLDLVLVPVSLAIAHRVDWVRSLPYAVGLVMLPLVLAVPMTVTVIALDHGFASLLCSLSPDYAAIFGATLGTACETIPDVGMLEMYGNVLAISVLAGGLLFLVTGGFAALNRPPAPTVQPGLRFLSRLPPHIGHDILYLQMQDHYLRVVTKGGEALILMPLRDAIMELDGLEGLQVHRSWWISLDAVMQIVRDGRRTLAVMTDGTRVPVSDTYRAALREQAGL